MKRILIIIAILVLGVGSAWGATYYVDSSITDTNVASATPDFTTYNPVTFATGTGSSSVYKTLADVLAKSFSGDDIIYFRRGQTWAERLRFAAGGTSGHQIIISAFGAGAAPIITGGAATGSYYVDKSYITLNNINFKGKPVWGSGTAGQFTNVIFNYCIIEQSIAEGLVVPNNATPILNNVLILNNARDGITAAGVTGAAVSMVNCIVSGNGMTSGYGVRGASGNITLTNCIVTGNSQRASYNTNAAYTDGGGNLIQYLSRPVSYKNNSTYFVLSFDEETTDASYPLAVHAATSSYGAMFSIFAPKYSLGAQLQSDLVTLSGYGHEVGIHGWSHSSLTATTGFAVTTTNADATVNVNRTAQTIVLTTTTPGNTVTVDWSSADKTIADLKTAVAGKAWTITNTTTPNAVTDYLRLSSLADSGGAQAAPYSPGLDVAAGNNYPFWHDEIDDTILEIFAITGVTPVTMAYPYGDTSAALEAYIQAVAGLKGARGVNWSATQTLSSIDIFKVSTIAVDTDWLKGDGTEAVLRQRARHYIEWCQQTGTVFIFYVHTAANLTAAQISYIVDEVYSAGGQFITFSSLIDAIKTDHDTSNGLTYTKTYSDLTDYRLQYNSPAKNAGVLVTGVHDVAGVTDYAGNSVYNRNGIDIGCYEYMENQSLGTGPAITLGTGAGITLN